MCDEHYRSRWPLARIRGQLPYCLLWKASILPSNLSPQRALPARFRRPRVLIVGCGDIGLRTARALQVCAGVQHARGPKIMALTSSAEKVGVLRSQGVMALCGNLDDVRSLKRLRGLASYVIHLAPPAKVGLIDQRTRNLIRTLGQTNPPCSLVYGSTTGVYGNCDGQWVSEERTLNPCTERAQRRADAEYCLRRWGVRASVSVKVLRIPGIYAADRKGGTPQGRLLKELPVLNAQEDVFTNHIHADDLAQIVIAALWRGTPLRTYNACDNTHMRMGEYFDWAADHYGLPRPARVSMEQAQQLLPPMMLSFLRESRRLRNKRMLKELRVRLNYPSVQDGLK